MRCIFQSMLCIRMHVMWRQFFICSMSTMSTAPPNSEIALNVSSIPQGNCLRPDKLLGTCISTSLCFSILGDTLQYHQDNNNCLIELGILEFIHLIYTKSCDRNFIIPIKMAVLAAVFGTEMCTGGAGNRASQSTSERRVVSSALDRRGYAQITEFIVLPPTFVIRKLCVLLDSNDLLSAMRASSTTPGQYFLSLITAVNVTTMKRKIVIQPPTQGLAQRVSVAQIEYEGGIMDTQTIPKLPPFNLSPSYECLSKRKGRQVHGLISMNAFVGTVDTLDFLWY